MLHLPWVCARTTAMCAPHSPNALSYPLFPPQVPEGDVVQCLEKAELVRPGTDVSIFTYSRMRYVVMQAVAELEKKGYNPEVRFISCTFSNRCGM